MDERRWTWACLSLELVKLPQLDHCWERTKIGECEMDMIARDE